MYARFPEHAHCRRLNLAGPLRAMLLALLVVVVAFAPPLTPQAQASSNPGVTISPGLLEVNEGGSASYTVVLDSEPASRGDRHRRSWRPKSGLRRYVLQNQLGVHQQATGIPLRRSSSRLYKTTTTPISDFTFLTG